MNVVAAIAFAARSVDRPRYYANDHSRDRLEIAPVTMTIVDARVRSATLDREGFQLVASPVRR